MELRTEIRRRLRAARDWSAVIDELEREVEVLPSEEEKSERLYELGLLSEEVIPERDRALAIYQRAWKLLPANLKALARARTVYREMGRLEMVAKVGEIELKEETDGPRRAELLTTVGEALLDVGQRDKAAEVLAAAVELAPDSQRLRDALAAAQYDTDDWLGEVERLGREADQADSQTAARMCLRAARILHIEMPEDPAYEDMLRRVLSYEPQNENGNFLFEALLAKKERWDELSAHHDKRAYAAADESDKAALYRKFALEWVQRFRDRERAAFFFAKALEAAYENGADKLPSQVAAFALLYEILGARKEWSKLLTLSDQALASAVLGEDEKLYAALVAGLAAWRDLGDVARARTYFDRVRQIAPDSAVLSEFESAALAQAPAPPAPAATAPVGAPALGGLAAPVAKTPAPLAPITPMPNTMPMPMKDDTLGEAQLALVATAESLEQSTQAPEKVIDAWKKAIAADPSKRSPRRGLARVLTKGERWNPLVEALKDEEAKACVAPEEKAELLLEMVAIYRERLRLDLMVLNTLNQVLVHRPTDLGVLDQLAAQYEAQKRMQDVIATLHKKAALVGDPAERVEILVRIANLWYEKLQNQAEAIKAFEAVLELAPDHGLAITSLRQVYEKRRDWEKLIALEKGQIAHLDDAGVRLQRSVDLAKLASEKLKKPAVSIALWADVTALDPAHAEALAELEKLYEREKLWDKLADVCDQQAELADDKTKKVACLQKLGILYTEKVNDTERAISAWRRLLGIEPDNRRGQDALKKLWIAQKAWTDLEEFYTGQGKVEEYVRVLERQVETEPDDVKLELSIKIAVLYRDSLKKPDRALRAFEKVLTLDGQHLMAAEALIPLYEQTKDHKKLASVLEIQLSKTESPAERQDRLIRLASLAEQQLKDKGASFGYWLRAFAEDHESTSVQGEVERLAKETGQWESLVDAYQRAVGKFASPKHALPLLSVVARAQENELGEPDNALATSQKILELDPDNAEALDALERLYLAKQRYGELLAIYEKKLELTLDPDARRTIRLKIGQLYEDEVDDDDKAIAAYEAVVSDFGDDREVLAALHRIFERQKSWHRLREILERELAQVLSSDVVPHVAFKFRLGQVNEEHLEQPAAAIECYRDILEIEASHEGARRELEGYLEAHAEPALRMRAAEILEPIYVKLEAWANLIRVHEIQLLADLGKEARTSLLLRIGELQVGKVGDADKGFDAYARALATDPSSAQARDEIVRLAEILDGGWEKLVALYDRALVQHTDLEPHLVHELSFKLAETLDVRLEEGARAVDYYRRALSVEPEDRVVLDALERLFSAAERYPDLLEIYRKKIEISQDPAERVPLLFRIAAIWEEMLQNPDEAILAYKEALGQDAVNRNALKALDRLFLGQARWQELADNLSRQLNLASEAQAQSEQVALLLRLAALRQTELGEVAFAVDTYRQVLELAPREETAVSALERLLGQAEHELTVAQILEPIYASGGDVEKQIGVYEIMVRHALDPVQKLGLLHQIGELHELMDGEGSGAKAFATYARALGDDPSSQATLEKLERQARLLERWADLVTLYNEVIAGQTDQELKIALLLRVARTHELELGADEAAVATYARVLDVDTKHLPAATAIVSIHERNSDFARLSEAIKKKAELVSELSEKKSLYARAAQIEEEVLDLPDSAIATHCAVLGLDDADVPTMDALERLYIRLERWNPLKDIYAKKAELAATPEDKKQMLFVLGQVYDRELSDVTRAIETYQAILDLDPEEGNAIQALDRLYGQAGRHYDLLQILEREVELSQSAAEGVAFRHRIGRLWEMELRDLSRAVEAYRDALATDPGHEPTLRALDAILHREGEPVLAAQVLEPIYEQSAEFEKLVDVYEVMVQNTQDALRRVELLHRIAALYEKRLDRADRAFQVLGRALADDPASELTIGQLERLAYATSAWDKLADLYEAQLAHTLEIPRQVDLLLRLARVYEEELGKAPLAIATHRRVLEADPENRASIFSLDRLYGQGEAWPELAEILRKEARLCDGDAEILATEFRLAQVYSENIRDIPSAIDVYREILARDASHGPTLAALELLFLEGNAQVEIAAILEPLYRASSEWEKLHKIHEVQLGKLSESGERQALLQRLAELAETRLLDSARAFRWWGVAFGEDPRAEKPWEELVRLASETACFEELVAVLTSVLAAVAEDDLQKSVLLRLGAIYDKDLHDPARAEESYLRVLGIDTKDPAALEALDRIYDAGGMFSELAEVLRRRVEITTDTHDLLALYFRLGRLFSEVLGDDEAAIGCYLKILDEESRSRVALESLELIYFRRREWQKLYDIYEKLVDVARGDSELADVYARMARLSSEALSEDERATELWNRVIDLRGEDPVGLTAMADLHERRGLWRELIDVVERQVRITVEPEDKLPLHKRIGRVWAEKLGRERNALEAWLSAYQLAPRDLETLSALSGLYRATQAWEELSRILVETLEVGQLGGTGGELSEAEMIDLYAQLGQLEGEVLGRLGSSVDAWRRVLALEPTDFRALGALEQLFSREARWEECIDILEKKAVVVVDPQQKVETLLQAGAIWEEKVGDKREAAQVYERVRSAEPHNTMASAQLEAIYRDLRTWDKLSEVLLERVEHTESVAGRIQILQQVARIYEEEQDDREAAFVVLQAAFKEDFADESTSKELERLATATGKWEELLADYSQVVAVLEHENPGKAADLWVKIGRWYGDQLSHVDYAIHSAQAALRLDPRHLGALSALADFQRKRGAWGELIEVLSTHAELEPDTNRKVDLYLSLAELQETQLMDALQAIAAYQSALGVDPTSQDALRALERLYRRSEMWEPLIAILCRKADACENADEAIRLRLEAGRLWDERLGEPAQAILLFKAVLVEEPRQVAALKALERLYEKTGQSEPYLDVLEEQLDVAPSDAERVTLYQRMASAWEERFGKLDRAAECLEKILVLEERNQGAYRELERLYRQEKKWDALVDAYARHIQTAGDPALRIDLHSAMGHVYEEELGDPDRAVEAYGQVLALDPDEPRALDAMGHLYEALEKWDHAVATMSHLIDSTDNPRLRVELHTRIGRILDERLKDTAGAEDRFVQALSQDSTHVPAMTALVGLYKRRGDYQKAAQMMVRAEQHTQHPLEKIRLLYEAATIFHQRLGDEDKAMEYFAATLALDPEHVEAGEPLSDLYFHEKKWAELGPILDMLVRKSDKLKKDKLNELYYRAARTADELGEHEKALKFYKQAYDLDATFLPTLIGRGNLLYKIEDWDGAGKIYQTILVQHRDAQKEGEIVEIYYRLGQVRSKLGERKKALNMFEKALELEPTHRPTLLAVIDLQAQQGDFEAVVHAKRSLLPQASEADKFKTLEEIGDLYQEKLANPQKSIAAYLEALDVRPKDHGVLHKVLERYSETKQWKKAIEVMLRGAELETDPTRRGTYLYSAAVTSRDEVKSLDEAVEYFNQALDAYFTDPGRVKPEQTTRYLKAFEAIDKILTTKKDWGALEKNYRKMIKRMPQKAGDPLLTMLWHNLGEIHRSRLKNFKSAAQAFEVAASFDPDNKQRHEILAELYVLAGPDYADKAVLEHLKMLRADPFKIDSYKALRKIYMDSHQYDKAFCLSTALAFLKKADPEEQQFFETYRPKGWTKPNQRMTDEIWKKVIHPDEDRYIGAILGAVSQGVALSVARPHKEYQLKRKERRQLENDQLLFSKVFSFVAQVLNVPLPEVYLQQDKPGEFVMRSCVEKNELCRSLVVYGSLLQGRPEKELAFSSAKQLCYMRPEYYLKGLMPTNTELKVAFLSALVCAQPKFPVPPDLVQGVQSYLPHLMQTLQAHPQWKEQLDIVVKRFFERTIEVDLAKWGVSVEATGHRMGFIMCGDLEVTAKMVSLEPAQVGAPQAKEKIKELLLYSVSEDYFAVRQHLGTVVG
jgi:tetratricopeptide (TPR) repeat protein